MADRTSAGLFAMLFESVASGKPLDAKELWRMQEHYDFAPQQMECNAALQKLGLLWVCKPCPRNDVTWNYGPDATTCEECSAPRPSM